MKRGDISSLRVTHQDLPSPSVFAGIVAIEQAKHVCRQFIRRNIENTDEGAILHKVELRNAIQRIVKSETCE
jgi:hypothetical protein